MKKIAQSLRNHKPLILNWFRARGEVSTGVVEGMNNSAPGEAWRRGMA
jgi:hypothetical protein